MIALPGANHSSRNTTTNNSNNYKYLVAGHYITSFNLPKPVMR